MSLRRLIIRLRVLFTILVVLAIVTVVGGLYHLHEQGLSDEAGNRVAKEMERFGIYAEFDNLSFHLIRGLTANNVSLFHSAERKIEVAQLPSLAIHVDKTKLMRGKLKITTIVISDAQLSLPLIAKTEGSPVISIANVSGSINIAGNQSLSTTDLSGLYEGLRISLSCNVWRDRVQHHQEADPEADKLLIERYENFLTQLKRWHWSEEEPPELKLFIEGNLSKAHNIDFDFVFDAPLLEFNDYAFEKVKIEGDWNRNLITLDTCEFSNQSDRCSIVTDFDLLKKDGRFQIDSTIHLQNFAQKVFKKRILKNFSTAGKTHIAANGSYQLPKSLEEKLQLAMTGNVSGHDFTFRGTAINTLTSDFSWNNGNLYLDKLAVDHKLGKLNGRIIIKDRLIRYQTTSSLPAKVYFPFIKNKRLVKELSKLKFTSKSHIHVNANGSINQDNPKDWNTHGDASLKNFSHNGVPANALKGKFKINRKTATFTNLTGSFDYRDYPLRRSFDGPESGNFSLSSISFDWAKKSTFIKQLKGNLWPAPVLRLFAPSIANHLEQYRFHQPPSVSCAGTICWNRGAQNTTRFLVGFISSGSTGYKFLKKNVTLTNIRGQVTVLPDKVQVNSLSAKAFGGNISGYLRVTPSNEAYSGRFQWDHLKLWKLSKTYDFKDLTAGTLTGSFKFRGKGNKISTLNGHGNLALSDGDLFAVPLFGPLSSLVNGVIKPVAKQKVLHDQAKDVSCNFSAKNGVFFTQDLSSMTPNTTFTGEGWINLNQDTLDLTIRMNFRGLMGLAEVPMKIIELPFQTLKSLFTGKEIQGLRQFRGTGKISNPKWKFSPFQPPRNGKNDPIFRKPPRARVVN